MPDFPTLPGGPIDYFSNLEPFRFSYDNWGSLFEGNRPRPGWPGPGGAAAAFTWRNLLAAAGNFAIGAAESAAARALLMRIWPGFAFLPFEEQQALQREAAYLLGSGVVLTAQQTAMLLALRRIARQENPTTDPHANVVFNWLGVENCCAKHLMVTFARMKAAGAWRDPEEGDRVYAWLGAVHNGIFNERGIMPSPFPQEGRRTAWIRGFNFKDLYQVFCLPQWSEGRKDQPDNKRLQRPTPRNTQGFAGPKPHKSPLGQEW